MSLFHSIWTVALLVIFLGIIAWAWSRRQKSRFDDAANIPFKEQENRPGDNDRG